MSTCPTCGAPMDPESHFGDVTHREAVVGEALLLAEQVRQMERRDPAESWDTVIRRSDLLGRPCDVLRALDGDSPDQWERRLHEALTALAGRVLTHFVGEALRADGTPAWLPEETT